MLQEAHERILTREGKVEAMDALERIVGMLQDQSPRKRIAAAVVLGELGAKSPPVVAALCAMARDELAALAEPAVEALGKVGARAALPTLLAALERKDLEKSASQAIAALGEEALPSLREKLTKATPEVRAAISGVLSAMHASFAMVLDGIRGQPWEVVPRPCSRSCATTRWGCAGPSRSSDISSCPRLRP